MKIKAEDALFVMIDVQERFRSAIHDMDTVIRNCDILTRSSELLGIRLIVTEQYPEGLGRTMSDIHVPEGSMRFEKTRFSIFDDTIRRKIFELDPSWIVLFGIESHVCVMQSALDAIRFGMNVMVVSDAVNSRSLHSKDIALDRMRQNGCQVVTTEMLLFEIMEDAHHPAFRKISRLIK